MMNRNPRQNRPHPALGLAADNSRDPAVRFAYDALLAFADPALRLIDQAKRSACVALGGFGVCVLGVHAAAQAPPDQAGAVLATLAAAAIGVDAFAALLALAPVVNQRRLCEARENRRHVFEQHLGSDRRAAFEAARGRDPRDVRNGVERLVTSDEGERLLLVRLAVARFETERTTRELRAVVLALFAVLAAAGSIPFAASLAATAPMFSSARTAGALLLAASALTLLLFALSKRQMKSLMELLTPIRSPPSASGLRLLAAVAVEQAELLHRHEDYFRAPPRHAAGSGGGGRPFEVGERIGPPEPADPDPTPAGDDHSSPPEQTRH